MGNNENKQRNIKRLKKMKNPDKKLNEMEQFKEND